MTTFPDSWRLMMKAHMPELMRLTTEWHGVPKGTEVRVLRAFGPESFYGSPCFEVERVDGEKLPTHAGPYRSTVIAANWLEPLT
jgi:hypothetical protein